jgi:aldose 1-epimerase
MFSVKAVYDQGFNKIILSDEALGTIAEVLPEWGAMLHSFSAVIKSGERIDIIDSYENADDIAENLTGKGFKSSKLSPFVCRLNYGKYNFEQQQYLITKFKLGDHAIHGLLYDQPFEVVTTGTDETAAWVTMQYAYRGLQEGFPFHYDCIVTYRLQKENTLTVQTEVINRTNGRLPIQDGWHPYFTLGGSINDLQLQFNSSSIVEFDEGLIPTGKLLPYNKFNALQPIGNTFLDNCFVLEQKENEPACILRNDKKNIRLEIIPEENYPYLQLYTPPHRNSIAIENLSSVPDAFNNGIGAITLEQDEKIAFAVRYKIIIDR